MIFDIEYQFANVKLVKRMKVTPRLFSLLLIVIQFSFLEYPRTLYAAAATKLVGTLIGTAGSWSNDGNTGAKAFDGNLSTWFDGPDASGDWVGEDFGSTVTISSISFSARPSWSGRMTGGVFQGSNDPTFTTGVSTLYTVIGIPAASSLTSVTLATPVTARYARYVGPVNGYCNVAEIQFFGTLVPASNTNVVTTVITPLGIQCGSPGTITSAYVGGQVPCVVDFDVTNQISVQTDTCLWHISGAATIADPTTSLASSVDGLLTTSLVAVEFDTAGTWVVSCIVTHVDKSVTTYATTVKVSADTRTQVYVNASTGNDANSGTSPAQPLATIAKAATSYANKGNAHIYFTGPLTAAANQMGSLTPKSNVVVDGLADSAGNQPVVTVGASSFAYVGSGVTDFLIRGITFTSVGTPGTLAGTTLAPISGNYRAEILQGAGVNSSVVNCILLCLVQGVQQYKGDVNVIECKAPTASTINGQVVLGTGPGRIFAGFNNFAGAFAEADIRTDSGVTEFGIDRNKLAMMPSFGSKPGFDGRCGKGQVKGNSFIDCQLSLSSSIGTTSDGANNTIETNIGPVLISGNAYSVDQAVPFTNSINIRSRAANVSIQGETFTATMPGVVTDTGLTNVVVGVNTIAAK